jgi:filamentous hemagglutinin
LSAWHHKVNSKESYSYCRNGINGLVDESAQFTLGERSSKDTTQSGISGIAGNPNLRSGDSNGMLGQNWNGNQLMNTVQGQMQVTAVAGREGSLAWGTYANGQLNEAIAAGDEEGIACWGPSGPCRAAGHAVVGGATGGVAGAVAAAGATVAGPLLYQTLIENGVDPELAGLVTTGIVTAGGVAVGGASGGAAAFNETTNNFALLRTVWQATGARIVAAAGGVLTSGQQAFVNYCNANATCASVVTALPGVAGAWWISQNTPSLTSSSVSQIPTGTSTPMVNTPPVGGPPTTVTPASPPNYGPNNTGNTNPIPATPIGTPPSTVAPAPSPEDNNTGAPIPESSGNNVVGGGFGAGVQPEVNPVVMATGGAPIAVDDQAGTHILDSDGNGGGHRAGTGIPGKSEFPASWSDEKILNSIQDIANDPNTNWSKPDRRGYVTGTGTRDGVEIQVVFDTRNGRIVTGYPINAPRNPK